ncbi:MAG: hypothetical protein HGB34_02415 [Candidatus Moranbacteria bacterium]|nr:hypothetical protein [Candidatus Moranbacteria bacterium]NTW75732.1 hypothetical protein [Candidatus Moranbacteria bacterium]
MSLSGNILSTIAYHDALDRPLTAFEVWKHLIIDDRESASPGSYRLGDVVSALGETDMRTRIASCDGFYVLPGREFLADRRIRAEKVAVAKLHRVRRLARTLRLVPFVRMIGITGSLAMKSGTTESDWDFFVVLRFGRIWIGRTVLTVYLHLLRKRRHGERTRDRVCLNYFVTDDHLVIPTEDLYSANEYSFLIPLLGKETFRRFELRNRWIAKMKPDFLPTETMPLWYVPESDGSSFIRAVFERVLGFDVLEAWLGKWQKAKIMRNPKTKTEGGHIEATDQALVFLPCPHGPSVYETYRKRLGDIRLKR